MAEPHVISALVKKRAELAGELAAHDRKRRAITDRLANVDSVLAMFGYEDDPKAIKPRYECSSVASCGERLRTSGASCRT